MMIRIFSYADLSAERRRELVQRPKMSAFQAEAAVRPILDDVRLRGDEAVHFYNRKFGAPASDQLLYPVEQLPEPVLSTPVKAAIDTALGNIRRFHQAQLRDRLTVETMPGVVCFREFRPIDRVGLYVPGGTAVLPSTAMMLAVPAQIAGCANIYLATPPDANGNFLPEIVYIAKKCGISGIISAGGAQAVGAFAYGTETIPKVDKIFGPGNQYVTAAKTLVANSDAHVAIDMPAGPSEVLVIADESADPSFVAADLLSQAEHGIDSQVVLILVGGASPHAVLRELETQLDRLPRKQVAIEALKNGFILQTENFTDALRFSNDYAPEHLILQVDGDIDVSAIRNAGSVFLGKWSPESAGDYASGTNHTLPTFGYARQYGGVSTESFGKYITFQNLSAAGLTLLGPHVEELAALEGLDAHKNAVRIRLSKLNH